MDTPKLCKLYAKIKEPDGAIKEIEQSPVEVILTKPFIDTSEIQNFRYFFSDNVNLSLVNNLDTSGGTDFTNMFAHCDLLGDKESGYAGLDSITLNTANGIQFKNMFLSCTSIKKISIDLSSADNVSNLFGGCTAVEEIDVVSTAKVTVFDYMFSRCNHLKTVNSTLDLSNATSNKNLFTECFELEEIRFVTDSIKYDLDFSSCRKLSSESIQSIIDGLRPALAIDGRTIKFNSNITKMLSQDQQTQLASKNWNVG